MGGEEEEEGGVTRELTRSYSICHVYMFIYAVSVIRVSSRCDMWGVSVSGGENGNEGVGGEEDWAG